MSVAVTLVLGAGGYVLALGVRELRAASRTRAVESVPVEAVGRDAERGEPVAVEGRAVPVSETLTAPFSGSECLAYAYETHEKIDVRNAASVLGSGRDRTEDEWVILDDGEETVEFVVEDETGRVRVDPPGADLRLATETFDSVPWRDMPGPLADYLDETNVVDRRDVESFGRWLKTPARRFREGRLEPGETVFVRDWVTADGAISAGPEDRPFVVGDADRRGLSWRDAKRGLLYVGMSACFCFAGGLVALSLL